MMRAEAYLHSGKPASGGWVWAAVGYCAAAGCLYWVFHDIRPADLLHSMAGVNWWWVIPAITLTLLVYVCGAWEWQLLMRPAGRLSLGSATKAMFAGRFANDLLPVHAGYVVRLYLASRWIGTSLASVVPSLVAERLFDSLWLLLGIGVAALFFPLPASVKHAGQWLGGAIVVGGFVGAWLLLRNRRDRPSIESARWVSVFMENVCNAFRGLRSPMLIGSALALSLTKLALQVVAFVCVLNAYHLSFPLRIMLGVFLIAYVGISLPSTPGSIGVFQLFCAAALTFFGIAKPIASSFALVAYVVLSAPLSVAGLVAVMRSGLTPRKIREEFGEWRRSLRSG